MTKSVDVYNAMAEGYLHGKTTTLFRTVQSAPIRKFLAQARGRGEDRWYSEMSYLVVGPGPEGNVEEWISQATLEDSYLDEMNPRNITFLDNSPVALELCRQYVHEQVQRRHGHPRCGNFVLGSGEDISENTQLGKFDVVVAALCDHMNTERFFEEAWRVLKVGGVLITSFPSDGLNRVVREQLYQIPASYTRFNIGGVPHLVPSRLMTSDGLKLLYRRYGFEDEDAINSSAESVPATETIMKAAIITEVDPQTVPLVVVGFGRKSGRK